MSDQYVGEIRMFSGNYAPMGWAMCNGQLLSVNQYEVLFTLLGTTYGGDGKQTFGLPDLRGRLPIHTGSEYALGRTGGSEQVTLTETELPAHTHTVSASSLPGHAMSPEHAYWAESSVSQYTDTAANGVMATGIISSEGGNQAHDNVMPYAVVTFIIALEGIYPSQSW